MPYTTDVIFLVQFTTKYTVKDVRGAQYPLFVGSPRRESTMDKTFTVWNQEVHW